jgi:uncharacterized repeat protein (TIGR01451 family)
MRTRRISSVRRVAIAGAIAGCALGFAASASASTTIGQLFVPNTSCATNTTYLQTSVSSGTGYTVPSAGVITSWAWEPAAETDPGLKLKVAQPKGGNDYKVVAEALAGAQTPNTATRYLTRISVQAGEIIGILFPNGATNCEDDSVGTNSFVNDDETPGSTSPYNPEPGTLPVSATIEPDANGDGFGDETQAKADLGITKSATAVAPVGGDITYTLTATNHGPEAAPGAVVRDVLPPGRAFVSAHPAQGSCDSTARCSLGTIASGASVTITIVVKAPPTSGVLPNIASIDSQALDTAASNYPGRGDTNAANNLAGALTIVGPPTMSGVTEENKQWKEPGKFKAFQLIPSRHTPIGTTFTFTLNRAANVRFDFTQPAPGRKANGHCVRPNRHNQHKRRCTRAAIRGSHSFVGHAGQNTVKFFGWLSRHKRLKPGKYTLVITATTPGAGSTSQKLKFTIVR